MTQKTETILDRIVADKRGELTVAKKRVPLAEVRAAARRCPAPRGFARALRMPTPSTGAGAPLRTGIALIAEVKKASPSRGVLREDFDQVWLAQRYAEGGAAAISVLTDERHFQGSLEHLAAIRESLADGPPLLRKDFLFDEYQVYEARVHGADALLLITAILENTLLRELLQLARGLGLDALVEVHDEAEMERALAAGASLIGITNRDLRTFDVDLATTERLRPLAPPDATIVAESGVFTRDDMLRMERCGVNAVLIGEGVVIAPDPAAKVRELLGGSGPTAEERERSFRRVRRYYSEFPEWERLARPADGALEFAVNKAWIERYLPEPGARVLDIGGGPGRYAIWLAGQGYRVTLADLSPDQLAVARERAAEAGVEFEAVVEANAMEMAGFPDASFDAVLCMGPMYHLIDEADRRQTASEVARVARPGVPVFVAFLNRLPLPRGMLGSQLPPLSAETEGLLNRWFETGVFIAPAREFFTDSYYAHPDEIRPLLERAGIATLELIASESLMGGAEERLETLPERQPELQDWVMSRLIDVANEPSVVGASWHILYIGRKR